MTSARKELEAWLTKLEKLIDSVETWATEFGWSSKRIEKAMDDTEVGAYSAPALLLQKETTKILLEPIARSAPGADGVVDLYLMPGYDDIASLYYYENRWHIHYAFAQAGAIAAIKEAEAKPLSQASLKRVLGEMTAHVQ